MGLSISDKLKKYITENGGDPSGAQTIAELVDKLPEGSGGGDSSLFILHATIEAGEEPVVSEAGEDILNAFNDGKILLAVDGEGKVYSLYSGEYDESYNSISLYFNGPTRIDSNKLYSSRLEIYWDSDGFSNTYTNFDGLPLLPSIRSDDYGKFLKVSSNGSLVWSTAT